MAPDWLDEANSEWDAEDDWDESDVAEIDDPTTETTVACPACGADIFDDAVRCPACGEYVTLADSSLDTPYGWPPGVVAVLIAVLIAALLTSMVLL